MRQFDPIAVLEAAYRLDLDDVGWLRGIAAALEPVLETSDRELGRRALACVGPHIVAGCRLRRHLADVVGDGAGRQVRGTTRRRPVNGSKPGAGDALRHLASAVDANGSRARRACGARVEEIWRGLCSGEWSLVDAFTAGGRRVLVVRRNFGEVRDPRALSRREREIAERAARGNKVIAYELGLTVSTVATHLSKVRRKLKCETRADLVRLCAWLDS